MQVLELKLIRIFLRKRLSMMPPQNKKLKAMAKVLKKKRKFMNLRRRNRKLMSDLLQITSSFYLDYQKFQIPQ